MNNTAISRQSVDYALKETQPHLGGGQVVGGRFTRSEKPPSPYDLVEQMQYLFVRVVKARDLPTMDVTGSLDPYVEMRVGNFKGITSHLEKTQNPEWNEVFAFSRDRTPASVLEVVVKGKDLAKDDFVGCVRFELDDVPTRVPPGSPLASEWYRLEDTKVDEMKGELMLAVWIGTQADEAFPDAWYSDAAAPSKVYDAPRLWYVRVNIIEAQGIIPADETRFPDVFVEAQIGRQVLRTKAVQARTPNPSWKEEHMFVIAGPPFEDRLVLSVDDRVGPTKDETIGRLIIPLGSIEKRADDRRIEDRWYTLEKPDAVDVDEVKKKKKKQKSSRIHIRVSLDGGYHVLEESAHFSTDLRPTAEELWKPSIGLLELGILGAEGLQPMKTREGKGTSDAYCVAKYNQKWVRTRTITDSLSPRYNEQYTWEVYDLATVLTVAVFDNCEVGELVFPHGKRDARFGKLRIRLSTLEAGRVYTHLYPLLVLQPSGVEETGELHLAVRFSSTSLINMLDRYSRPVLPKMQYIRPLSNVQLDTLSYHAVLIVALRLARMQPPLRKEVVEYMCGVESDMWSMRRSKATFFRLMSVISGLVAVGKWFGDVVAWKNPTTTVLVHIVYIMAVYFRELMLPAVFLSMFLTGVWNYRYRPRHPPFLDTKLSYAEDAHPDELDEEFDTFPTSRNADIVRFRYDRLRSIAGRIQTVASDIAAHGERMQALLRWRDPRATAIFVLFCFIAALMLYLMPFPVLALAGLYVMRHPRFRHGVPSAPISFFRRLPARADSLL